MIEKGDSRVFIGFLTFFAEYGAIILSSLLLQFSSDFIFRLLLMYFITQLIFGHYHSNTSMVWEEIRLLIISHLSFFLASLLLVPLMMQNMHMVVLLLVLTIWMLIYDIAITQLLRHLLYRTSADNVLIIGTGTYAQHLGSICDENHFAFMRVKGFVDMYDKHLFPGFCADNDMSNDISEWRSRRTDIYPVNNLGKVLEEQHIDQVIIAVPSIRKEELEELMVILHQKVQKIKYIPLVNGLITFDSKIEDFDGLLVISSSRGRNTWPFKILKRLIDITGSLLGCLFLLPICIYVKCVNMKNGDHGNIFFIQKRIGKNGKLFKIYKFRTMIPNAEAKLKELMETDEKIRKEYSEHKKLMNDPRITKAGAFLRKRSLDEMPQMINVLKGEMSLVGPRPYLPNEKTDMGIYYSSVIQSKPGITGMWQSHGRNDVNFMDRCRLDDYYYSNWNLWLDITILIKTIKVVVYGKGAF